MSSSADKTQEPLAQADANKKMGLFNEKPTPAFADEAKQHHSLHAKVKQQEYTGKQSGTYVSPSDNILSPASTKLNALKEKRFSKTAKPRTLFGTGASQTSGLGRPLFAGDM